VFYFRLAKIRKFRIHFSQSDGVHDGLSTGTAYSDSANTPSVF
jgi:hypothetical protein